MATSEKKLRVDLQTTQMDTSNTPILKQSEALQKLQCNFLDIQSIVQAGKTCRTFRWALKESLEAAELMDHVLNIDENKQKRISDIIKENPERILYRTTGRVTFFSNKQQKNVIRIEISNVSPLEASALSGDFHLVKVLANALPDNEKYEAGLQIQTILSRPDFLTSFKVLQAAYQKFFKEFDGLFHKKDQKTIDELWAEVGEYQKKLSTFGLQVFNNLKVLLPDFTKEPSRSMLMCYNLKNCKYKEIDFSTFGLGTTCALTYSLNLQKSIVQCFDSNPRSIVYYETQKAIQEINLLCKVISEQLSETKTLLLQYEQETSQTKDSESYQLPPGFLTKKEWRQLLSSNR